MRRVTVDFSEDEAEIAIQTILRAVALLDLASKNSEAPMFRRACVEQSCALHDLMEQIDNAARGVAPARERLTG